MKATLETVVGIIRIGDEHEKFGDPYDFVATVIGMNSTAEIRGAVGVLTQKRIKLIARELKAHGFKSVIWERLKKSGDKQVKVRLKR